MKYQYHVAIITDDNKIKYVTSINNLTKLAKWEAGEKAMKLNSSVANDLMYGLRCNGYTAVVIRTLDFDELVNF